MTRAARSKPLFIVNTQSEAVKRKGSLLEVVAEEKSIPCDILDDFKALPGIVKDAAKANNSWVIIEGGDGTAQGVLSEFLRQRDTFAAFPKFTLLRGGMTNQVAKNIGLKRYTHKSITNLLDAENPTIAPTPLLSLDIVGADPIFGFLLSSGAVPMATDYCKEQIHARGLGGSMAVAATILRGVSGNRADRDRLMPPTRIVLRVTNTKEETVFDEDHLGTLVTTLPSLIIGLDPFWGNGDGALRLTYAKADARHLLRHIIGFWIGYGEKSRTFDGYESHNADLLRFEYEGPIVLDGEPVTLPKGVLEIRATEPIDFVY